MKLPVMSPQGRLANAYLTYVDASGTTQTLVFDVVESEEWEAGSDISESPVEIGANITDNIRPTLRRCTLKVYASNKPILASQWANGTFGPGDGFTLPAQPFAPPPTSITVKQWNSHLMDRILANTAGGALGSFAGSAGGAAGALAGSLIGGALFTPEEVDTVVPAKLGLSPPPAPATLNPSVWGWDNPTDFVQQTLQLLESLRQQSQTFDLIGTKEVCLGTTPGLGGMAMEGFSYVRGKEEGSGASITLVFKEFRVVSTVTVPAPAPTLPRTKPPVAKGNQEGSSAADAAQKAAAAFLQGLEDGIQTTTSALGGGS